MDAAKAAGRVRVEGKDYRVQEEGILHLRFAVWPVVETVSLIVVVTCVSVPAAGSCAVTTPPMISVFVAPPGAATETDLKLASVRTLMA